MQEYEREQKERRELFKECARITQEFCGTNLGELFIELFIGHACMYITPRDNALVNKSVNKTHPFGAFFDFLLKVR